MTGIKRHAVLAGIASLALLAGACVVREARPAKHYRASAQGTVHVGSVPQSYTVSDYPPEPLYESMTVSPGYGYVWLDGYWHWNGYEWEWIGGRWVEDRPGYIWVQPYYGYTYGSYSYQAGYWCPRNRLPRGVRIRDHRRGRPSVAHWEDVPSRWGNRPPKHPQRPNHDTRRPPRGEVVRPPAVGQPQPPRAPRPRPGINRPDEPTVVTPRPPRQTPPRDDFNRPGRPVITQPLPPVDHRPPPRDDFGRPTRPTVVSPPAPRPTGTVRTPPVRPVPPRQPPPHGTMRTPPARPVPPRQSPPHGTMRPSTPPRVGPRGPDRPRTNRVRPSTGPVRSPPPRTGPPSHRTTQPSTRRSYHRRYCSSRSRHCSRSAEVGTETTPPGTMKEECGHCPPTMATSSRTRLVSRIVSTTLSPRKGS